MKRIIALLAGVALVGVMNGMAQGTLLFQNTAATRVKTPEAVNIPSSAGYTVELLYGTSSDVSTMTSAGFASFSAVAGIFNGGTLTLTGAATGSSPWVTIRVWDTKGATVTSWSQVMASTAPIAMGSATWQLTGQLGGPNPPNPDNPPLTGLPGFVAPTLSYYVVPEPATYALLALGAAALLLRRRK